MKTFLLIAVFLFSFSALACPACPAGSSTSGTGEATNLPGCKCNGSGLSWDGSSCISTAPCGGAYLGWGSCGANFGAQGHNSQQSQNNTVANYTGSATFTCFGGSWSGPNSQSCNPVGCTVGWGTPNGGASCTIPGGGTMQSGCTNTYYTRTSVNQCTGYCGGCWDFVEDRTCSNGVLSGSATITSCYEYCSCFIAGTQVTMADGSTKNIEDVQEGESVRTYDELTKEFTVSPVVKTLHHNEKHEVLYEITFDDGVQLTSNEIHPYYIVELGSYLMASEVYQRFAFNQSLHLLRENGQLVGIANIQVYEQTTRTYNLHVKGRYDRPEKEGVQGHNYFANGVLVHNKTVPCY